MSATDIRKHNKIIFKTVAGSHLYGTNTEASDIDTVGVYLPTREALLSFEGSPQTVCEAGEETTLHELRKFLSLAKAANATTLELLFAPEQFWKTSSPEWAMILANRSAFLSTKARHSFAGYAWGQLNRVSNHRQYLRNPLTAKPTREEFGLPKQQLLTDTQIGALQSILVDRMKQVEDYAKLSETLQEFTSYQTYQSLVQSNKYAKIPVEYTADLLQGEVAREVVAAFHKEKEYKGKLEEWNAYKAWEKARNPRRAELEKKYGYDTKHTSHVFRLLSQCEELLTTGYITLPRPDADWLKAIRNGLYSFEEVELKFAEYKQRFDQLYTISALPREPDSQAIVNLCQNLLLSVVLP